MSDFSGPSSCGLPCHKKTGKTMEQLIEEKRKELDEKIAKGGDENIKYATPGKSDILP